MGDIGSGVIRRGACEGVGYGTVVGGGRLGARARGGGGIPRPELCDPDYKNRKLQFVTEKGKQFNLIQLTKFRLLIQFKLFLFNPIKLIE